MGSCISCIACNSASYLCSGVCKCCGKIIPIQHIAGRIGYTIIFFLFSLLAWIFQNWGQNIFQKVSILNNVCKTDSSNKEEQVCFGTFAVYRISFCLAIFHYLLAVIMIGVRKKGDFRVSIQDQWWFVKLLILVGGCIGTFFIPNPVFSYYGWMAFSGSAIFILIQLILLVDFAHSWAENWIEKMESSEEGDKKWFIILLSTSLFFISISIAASIIMYIFFCKDSENCQHNVAFITLNIIFCIIICFLSIHPRVQHYNERSGLLQSSFIVFYTTYLVWSALMSEDDICNPWSNSNTSSNISLFVGCFFTIIAVLYAALSTANSVNSSIQEHEPLLNNDEEKHEEDDDDHHKEHHDKEENLDEPVSYNFSKFHFIFALGAMYISMLISNWQTVNSPGTINAKPDTGIAAVWVKVITSWLCLALYTWTLIADRKSVV